MLGTSLTAEPSASTIAYLDLPDRRQSRHRKRHVPKAEAMGLLVRRRRWGFSPVRMKALLTK